MTKAQQRKLFPTKFKYKYEVGDCVVTQAPKYSHHAPIKDTQAGAAAIITSIKILQGNIGFKGAEAYCINIDINHWYYVHELEFDIEEKIRML